MPQIEDQMEKNKQPFRLKLCQRLADPGGMVYMWMSYIHKAKLNDNKLKI